MPIKAVLFDFMGTCLDWHSSIKSVLPSEISADTRSKFAIEWRHNYFDANAKRQAAGLPPEDIDITHRQTLDELLAQSDKEYIRELFTEDVKEKCVQAWHSQPAWPDVAPALAALKTKGYEIFVHANGTPRLQLDLCRNAGLKFDMLFSSKLLGVYKPAPEAYTKALDMLKYSPDEVVMVAAHAYDTAGAKTIGIKTVYIYRWTDDVNEDQEVVRRENDVWLEDMSRLEQVISSF